MAAGVVLATVQAIPWTTVLDVTPRVIDGARQLIQAIRRRPRETPLLSDPEALHDAVTDPALLESALRELEATVSALDRDLRSAGEVIEGLANANEALVGAVAQQRLWLFGLAGLTGISLFLTVWMFLQN